MKILVVSGFLGAGKTTFIEQLVKYAPEKTVILENEYGEVAVDGDILKEDGLNIWELTEGCVCCSMKANFAESILTIANTMNPELLIIEPTGVGLLSSVLNNISKVLYERIEILEPITVVDPFSIDSYEEQFKEIFENQIRYSKDIIISKVDKLASDEKEKVKEKIAKMNNRANINMKNYDEYSEQWWKGLLDCIWNNKSVRSSTNVSLEIENIGFENVEFDNIEKFESYMSAVMSGRFGNIVRAKGFLKISDNWAKMDIVDKQYTLIPANKKEKSKVVFIGTNIDKQALNLIFK